MKKNFSNAKRGQVIPTTGKTRITIYLDDEIVAAFRRFSEKTGKGYQTLINDALIAYLGKDTLTPAVVRKIIREELAAGH